MATIASHAPHLQVIWTDPVTGRQGFVVIDRLVRGVSSGGLRMRRGCTLDEVRGLAEGMTRKEALHYQPGHRYIPLGGAKGGIDCDPEDPQAFSMLARFLDGVRAIVERHWTTGEDLGVRQETIDAAITRVGLTNSIQAIYPLLDDPDQAKARLAAAFDVTVAGVSLPELVGGLGVAEAVLTYLDREGKDPTSCSAVIQGFGSMGGATARYLARAGVKVVGLADVHGTVANSDGLDVERLLGTRDPLGGFDRDVLRDEDHELAADGWLDVDCDVLVPAAVSYCLTAENQHRVRAEVVAEAANMPTLPEAETMLRERGVTVLPDFVANSATNAWWWWTLFGDIGADADEAEAMVRRSMRDVVGRMLDGAEDANVSPRSAAQDVVEVNLAAIDEAYGPAAQ